eukprot:Amastigsp_a841141_295.p3 type:complete len:111 gc:universal Amastigsp_a841141_295:660-328(-)
MVRTRRSRLTAEMSGGRWNSAPVRVSMARASLISDSRASCRRMMHTYSLPADCWALTSRVARSTQTMRQPVTLGSRVPECPVLSTRRMRLIHATTSCDEGLAGLSRLMTP